MSTLAQSNYWQVLCATHSSHFVSKNSSHIPSIVRICRTEKGGKIFQIDEAKWNDLVNANQQINSIAQKYPKMRPNLDDQRPEMEAVKNFLWLNPDRSSLFFANHVLLVEGATELALINKLIGDGKIKNADCGVYVLDCLGKYNIHRFMNLLISLGIPHSAIYDGDNNRAEHADLKQLIESTQCPNLTKITYPLAKDLETFLGIPPSGSPHRKPQHVLLQYEMAKIDEEKLAHFCSIVDACLPTSSD